MAMQNKTRAYCWIYDEQVNTIMKSHRDSAEYGDISVRFYNLESGQYDVEFWDTYKGIVTDRQTVQTQDHTLDVKVPPFRRDIALKVKQTPRPVAEVPSP